MNASKALVSLTSRSRIRMRSCFPSFFRVARTLRACWVTQAPLGWAVMPAMCTRRRSSSMKKETYRRRSQSVSTVKKARSAGDRVDAVAAEDVPDGARREREAEPGQFAVDALVAPARILGRQPQHELARLRDHRWSAGRSRRKAPASAHKLAMPAQQRRRLDEQRTHAR